MISLRLFQFAFAVSGFLAHGASVFSDEAISLKAVETPDSPSHSILLHVRSGESSAATLTFEGVAGRKAPLHYRLFQITSGLAVPAGPERFLGALEFMPSSHAVIGLNFVVPEVREKTRFVLKLEADMDGKRVSAGKIFLLAYPNDLTERLQGTVRRLEKESGLPIALFGNVDPLRSYLKASGIKFDDLGADFSTFTEGKRVYIGSASAEVTADRFRDLSANPPNLVLFTADEWSDPGVCIIERNGSTLTNVRTSVPEDPGPGFIQLLIDILSEYPSDKFKYSNL